MKSKGRPPTKIRKERKRPLTPIDWKQVDAWIIAGANGVQIAAQLGIHADTLYDRCLLEHEVIFSAYFQEKRSKGDLLLHQIQFDSAVRNRNTQLLLHLGKHRLDQKDNPQLIMMPPNDKNIEIEHENVKLRMRVQELEEKMNALIAKADAVLLQGNESV